MTKKSEVGKLGEDIACEYLINKGFEIIERNFRKPWGEIDIITKDQNGILVFVEVKAMKKYNNSAIAELLPEENLTAAKLKKLQRTASLYVNRNSDLIDDKKGWQIDLVAIVIPKEYRNNDLTEFIKYCDIKHFENI